MFFFLLRFWLLLHRPQVADLGVGFDKFSTELLVIAKLGYFAFCFSCSRWGGQRLAESFAVHFIGKPEIGTVARLTWPMAAAV